MTFQQPVSLSVPPWESAKPIPLKRKRYGNGNFPRGTPWVERYWRRRLLTDRQYATTVVLMKANKPTRTGYASTSMQPRVDGGAAFGVEDVLDQQTRLRELCRAIPEQFYVYVRVVVLEDQSLYRVKGCSGGANFTRYIGRLKKGLDALHVALS